MCCVFVSQEVKLLGGKGGWPGESWSWEATPMTRLVVHQWVRAPCNVKWGDGCVGIVPRLKRQRSRTCGEMEQYNGPRMMEESRRIAVIPRSPTHHSVVVSYFKVKNSFSSLGFSSLLCTLKHTTTPPPNHSPRHIECCTDHSLTHSFTNCTIFTCCVCTTFFIFLFFIEHWANSPSK